MLLRRLVLLSQTIVLALVFTTATVRATIAPPIKIRLSGGPVLAKAGEELRGSFELRSGAEGQLYDLELSGRGWTTRLEEDTSLFLKGGETRRIGFVAVPTDPSEPLRLRGMFEGAPIGRDFQLDAASLAKRQTKLMAAPISPDGPKLQYPADRSKDQTLRFRGRVMYYRSDNLLVGADTVLIRVMDEDTFDSEQITAFATDSNGNFDVTVQWDDCDVLGCDDPDIYLVIQAVSTAAIVRADDEDETLYEWNTSVLDDFTGDDIDYGVLVPTDPSTYGALHVFTSHVRAWRLAQTNGAMTAPTVEVRWPDNQGGTYYNALSEVHIGLGETWTEATHHHEFGHHLQQIFAISTPVNYNNGFCDTPNPGHCVWCPENPTDAWQEGWPDWFGGHVNRVYQGMYGVTPLSMNDNRYDLEQTFTCGQDGQTYANASTEGWIGALLRDIEDSSNDDHDGGAPDCDMDVLSLGDDEIFTVFRDDDPTTLAQFMASFRARYPQHDTGLWSTARNVTVNFGFPTPQPVVISQPLPCSNFRYGDTVVLSVNGNGPLLQYQWLRDGMAIGGSAAQSASYSLGPLTPGMNGVYSCRVTSCDGTLSATSAGTTVRVFGDVGKPLVSWGENSAGQGGIGNNDTVVPPTTVPSIPDLIAADGGRGAITGIRANGDVYTWGVQGWGELGNNGNPYSTNVPTQIFGISNAVEVASGSYHSLVLQADGSVRAFGYNGTGALGDQSYSDRWAPVSSVLPTCVVDVAAGWYFSLFLGADGKVYACGDNDYGQLGNGTTGARSNLPTAVLGLEDVVAIAASAQTGMALKADGTVWLWGQNNGGQHGNDTTTPSALPVQAIGLGNVRSIGLGRWNAYAIDAAGTSWSWGTAAGGGLGDPSVLGIYRLTPGTIPGLVGAVQFEVTETTTTLALLADGTVWAWGRNDYNCFGVATPTVSYAPLPVTGVHGAKGIGASYGTVFAFGQVGSVTAIEDPVPGDLPTVLALRAHPNPFASRASLSLALPQSGRASVRIYDVAGRLVRTVLDEVRPAGVFNAHWDGRDDSGASTAAGVYMARLQVGEKVVSSKLLRLE